MISENELLEQISIFKVPDKTPVIVHSSLKSIGCIDGGAETLLSVLRKHFCKNGGLLCIPTHTWDSLVLDLTSPKSNIGALPTVAACHPDGIRSLHPTHSITVFGEGADKFVENEIFSDTPTNPDSCYGSIYNQNGYVLLIGVDQRKNTLIHCFEEMMSVKGRLTEDKIETTIIHKDGREEKRMLYWFDESKIPDVSVFFDKFEPAFRHYGCIIDGKLGNADVQLCNARKMKEVMDIIYKRANGKELLSDNTPLDEVLYI